MMHIAFGDFQLHIGVNFGRPLSDRPLSVPLRPPGSASSHKSQIQLHADAALKAMADAGLKP
jgi:hypothetical protein